MTKLEHYIQLINDELYKCLPSKNVPQSAVIEAMEYSLVAGGKRVRPVLTLEFCKVCGGDINFTLPFACAVELIHTYSLIHDDLPCMDNDSMRRGKPANHIANGEAMALLAGDALLTRAFELMLADKTAIQIGAARVVEAARCLADSIGVLGMIGGQVIDIEAQTKRVNLDSLTHMHSLKTGALIVAAAKIGCIAAGASAAQLNAAEAYTKKLGLAFQIMDDILDETATSEALGKNAGSDKANNKVTYVSFLGLEKAVETVQNLTSQAVSALDVFGSDTSFLRNLAIDLATRNH